MDNLIHIVGDELHDWEKHSDMSRYSIFTQNIMLAEIVSKHQHLNPRKSKFEDSDRVPSADLTLPNEDKANATNVSKTLPNTTLVYVNKPQTRSRPSRQSSTSSSGDWTWRPQIPHRVSSMSTRRKNGATHRRPDMATFHRRSCQLFSSLDSTLSNAQSVISDGARTSTSTPPSLTSSISTEATATLDNDQFQTPAFSSFHLDLDSDLASQVRRMSGARDPFASPNVTPQLGPRRSSSRLSPHIVSTEQVFWTSDTTRNAEYAKIDAAHNGFRGLMKRVLPKSWAWAHGKRRNFHPNTPSDQPFTSPDLDSDSIRRYRISLASTTQEAVQAVKSCASSRAVTPMPLGDQDLRPDSRTERVKRQSKLGLISRVRSSEALSKLFPKSSKEAKKSERQPAQL